MWRRKERPQACTRAQQHVSNWHELVRRDEGSRTGQCDSLCMGAGGRSAHRPEGRHGHTLCWAGRWCRDGPEAWAPSSVGGAAEHLNEDVRDAVDLGLDGRCDEEEDGSTRAGTLRFSLRSGSRQREEVNLQLQPVHKETIESKRDCLT